MYQRERQGRLQQPTRSHAYWHQYRHDVPGSEIWHG